MQTVQIRCPVGPGRLLAILRQQGDKPNYLPGNVVEFACSDCARDLRKRGYDIARVLHRYNFAGELVESIEVERGEEFQTKVADNEERALKADPDSLVSKETK